MSDSLDLKLSDAFAGKVVRKDLVRKIKVSANVPIFVLEYLLGKYCATDDLAAIEAGDLQAGADLLGQSAWPILAWAVVSRCCASCSTSKAPT